MKSLMLGMLFAMVSASTSAKPLEITALHCGSLPSPDSRFKADFTVGRSKNNDLLRISSCDRTSGSCKGVFKGSASVPTRVHWAGKGLVIERKGGLNGQAEDADDGSGHPVIIRIVPSTSRGGSELINPGLAFDKDACRIDPPIVARDEH